MSKAQVARGPRYQDELKNEGPHDIPQGIFAPSNRCNARHKPREALTLALTALCTPVGGSDARRDRATGHTNRGILPAPEGRSPPGGSWARVEGIEEKKTESDDR